MGIILGQEVKFYENKQQKMNRRHSGNQRVFELEVNKPPQKKSKKATVSNMILSGNIATKMLTDLTSPGRHIDITRTQTMRNRQELQAKKELHEKDRVDWRSLYKPL